MVTTVLVGIAGLSFLLNADDGLYWMMPDVLASLADGTRLSGRAARRCQAA